MKKQNNPVSRYTVLLVGILLVLFRFHYLPENKKSLNVTTWDAFGYYMYLPATIIYHDTRELKWVPAVDKTYNVTGGKLYQAGHAKNGNDVFKYLGGVAILQLPFFLIAHAIAHISGAPADGFSWPYQYCISFGAILWALFGIFLLRKILLRFFTDSVTAVTLMLLLLASNFIQYTAIENAMSHVWIFPLYPLVMYATIRWHESPSWKWAVFIGGIIGLATICRPTEAVMLFIPLLWNTHSKEESKKKWSLVKQNRSQIIFLVAGGLIGIAPQLIYWKYATDHFVYDVGSKWVFANPYFRVLFGWEKGWLIYTPVAVLMVTGFFFLKKFPFRKSVLVFCLLNIWIIIAWSDWRYGASYSCRAMVQSYPVFALALAALIARMEKSWQKISMCIIGIYLIGVNFFQVYQYNTSILHYNDMNRAYYEKIYLNASPSALDFSLLDNPDYLNNENDYDEVAILTKDSLFPLVCTSGNPFLLATLESRELYPWLKVNCRIKTQLGHRTADLRMNLFHDNQLVKTNQVRLFYPTSSENDWNEHAFFINLPAELKINRVVLQLESFSEFKGEIKNLKISGFAEKMK